MRHDGWAAAVEVVAVVIIQQQMWVDGSSGEWPAAAVVSRAAYTTAAVIEDVSAMAAVDGVVAAEVRTWSVAVATVSGS